MKGISFMSVQFSNKIYISGYPWHEWNDITCIMWMTWQACHDLIDISDMNDIGFWRRGRFFIWIYIRIYVAKNAWCLHDMTGMTWNDMFMHVLSLVRCHVIYDIHVITRMSFMWWHQAMSLMSGHARMSYDSYPDIYRVKETTTTASCHSCHLFPDIHDRTSICDVMKSWHDMRLYVLSFVSWRTWHVMNPMSIMSWHTIHVM